ncbi:MAG: MBL fold metallo-hydrolase [Myxococcota bacterium]
MARADHRLPENVPGDFFVDSSCIDCDRCRQLAPGTFGASSRGQSYVHHQPSNEVETRRALLALVTCPVASIGSAQKHDVTSAAKALPERIVDEIYDCGFASESSYGATSYLVRRERGNVLVDSPRAVRGLMERMTELGGISRMFLTHADDVADHAKLHARFHCERILHRADVHPGTRDVERQLEGTDPVALDDDLLAIPVPGHTRGSTALLYRNTYLFTGDHLWWDDDENELHASRSVCWYSWAEQTRSMERLLDNRFEWVLPGHGRRHHAPASEMKAALERLVARMRQRA